MKKQPTPTYTEQYYKAKLDRAANRKKLLKEFGTLMGFLALMVLAAGVVLGILVTITTTWDNNKKIKDLSEEVGRVRTEVRHNNWIRMGDNRSGVIYHTNIIWFTNRHVVWTNTPAELNVFTNLAKDKVIHLEDTYFGR